MPTRNVVLTDRQHEIVETLVREGRYQNASEVLRDGLRLLERRDALESAKLRALSEASRVGWRDLEEGRYRDVGDDDLDEFIGGLGADATGQYLNRG